MSEEAKTVLAYLAVMAIVIIGIFSWGIVREVYDCPKQVEMQND